MAIHDRAESSQLASTAGTNTEITGVLMTRLGDAGFLGALMLAALMPYQSSAMVEFGLELSDTGKARAAAMLVVGLGPASAVNLLLASKRLSDIFPSCAVIQAASRLVRVDASVTAPLVRQSPCATNYHVAEVMPSDAEQLRKLYNFDYVDCHLEMHKDVQDVCGASFASWENALGSVDFPSVIADMKTTRLAVQATTVGRAGSTKNVYNLRRDPRVGLLKCVEKNGSLGRNNAIIGYVLYELREKGSAKKRQHYCEVVNIVVSQQHRGHGAGRRLYEALVNHLDTYHSEHATSLRLYVAERNATPRCWYLRLGFKESGWQSEHINCGDVKFVRMIRERQRHS